MFLFRTKFEMVGHEGPCPLTAPCLSVLWLSVGLRGVVDVPPAAWVTMPDLDRTALPSGGDLACRIGGLRREGRQSYVLALLQCVLRIPLLQLSLFLFFWGTAWRLLIFS